MVGPGHPELCAEWLCRACRVLSKQASKQAGLRVVCAV